MRSFYLLCRFSAVAAIGLILCAAPARAIDPAKQCRKDARNDRHDCIAVCQDNYQAAAALCGTPCVQQCGVDRKACRGPVDDQLRADIKACNTALSDAVRLCRQQEQADPDNFDKDACIDAAQITAFICRDDAREAAFPAMNLCRETYHACVRACP